MTPLPKSTAEKEEIVDEIFQGMIDREEDAVRRLETVIEFATKADCEYSVSVSLNFPAQFTNLHCS